MAAPRKRDWQGNILFLVGLVLALIVGWVLFPQVLYSKKTQPVDFAHSKHGPELDLTCDSCHKFRSDGSFAGIPANKTCAQCHETDLALTQSDDPREAHYIKEYLKKNREVDWYIYSKQPPCVYFTHTPHIKMAKMECVTCHGPKADEKTLPPFERNFISQYSRNIWGRNISGIESNSWGSMKMDDCGDCHQEKGVSNACFVCHK